MKRKLIIAIFLGLFLMFANRTSTVLAAEEILPVAELEVDVPNFSEDAVPEVESVVDAAAVPEVESEVDADAVAETESVVDAEAVPEAESEVDAAAVPEVECEVDVDAVPEVESEVDAEAVPEVESVVDVDAVPEIESVVDTEAVPEVESVVDAEAVPENESEEQKEVNQEKEPSEKINSRVSEPVEESSELLSETDVVSKLDNAGIEAREAAKKGNGPKNPLAITSMTVTGEYSFLEEHTTVNLSIETQSSLPISSYTYCILEKQGTYQVIYHGETPQTTYEFQSSGDYQLYAKVTDTLGREAHYIHTVRVYDLTPSVSIRVDNVPVADTKIHTVGLYRFDLVVNRAPQGHQTQMYLVYPKGNYQVMPVNNWLLLKFYYPGQYIMRADVKTGTGGNFKRLFPFVVSPAPNIEIKNIIRSVSPNEALNAYDNMTVKADYNSPFEIKHYTYCLLDSNNNYTVFHYGQNAVGNVRVAYPGDYKILVKVEDIYGRSAQRLSSLKVKPINPRLALLIDNKSDKTIFNQTRYKFEITANNLPVDFKTNMVLIAPDQSYRILPTSRVVHLTLDELGTYTIKAYVRPYLGGEFTHAEKFEVTLVPLSISDLRLTPQPLRIRQESNIQVDAIGANTIKTVFSYWLKTPGAGGYKEIIQIERANINWTFQSAGEHKLIVVVARDDGDQVRYVQTFNVLLDLPWAEITQIKPYNCEDYGAMAYGIIMNDGTHVFIDGGINRAKWDSQYSVYSGDGTIDPVYSYIKNKMAGRVDVWLVTHFHDDHFGNAANIINNCSDIKVKQFVGVTPTYSDNLPGIDFGPYMQNTLNRIKNEGRWREVRHGEVLHYGELSVEVMQDLHQVSNRWDFNDTTTVFRINLGRTNKKFIVLGDLYVRSGDVFLYNHSADALKSDIVSVSHHGIKGVNPIIYDRIRAPIAFVPSFEHTYTNSFWLYQVKPAISRWANLIIHGMSGTYTLRVE